MTPADVAQQYGEALTRAVRSLQEARAVYPAQLVKVALALMAELDGLARQAETQAPVAATLVALAGLARDAATTADGEASQAVEEAVARIFDPG